MIGRMSQVRPSRRALLLAGTGAAALGGIGVAARLGPDDRDGAVPGHAPEGQLRLTGSGGMGVSYLSVPLARNRLLEVATREWRSAPLTTSTYSMVGFTWRRGEAEPGIAIRSRVNGIWQPWQDVPHMHDVVDPDEATETVGTEPTWVGRSDAIRVRVSGNPPTGFTLVLLHPTPLPGDREPGLAATSPLRRETARVSRKRVPRPRRMRTRRDWGADERLRDGKPRYNKTIKQVHVHHTANSNVYRRKDVPAMIRGMYAYHTQSLGWSDIGYNFLVDRFGRLWVGRAGGPGRAVRGAHTLGFNHASTGIAVIGNYDRARADEGRDPRHRPSRRMEAGQVRPRPARSYQGDLPGQRQVPRRAQGLPPRHRRASRHQPHRLPGAETVRRAAQGPTPHQEGDEPVPEVVPPCSDPGRACGSQTLKRPAKARSGRSALVMMPGGAATTERIACRAGMPVTVIPMEAKSSAFDRSTPGAGKIMCLL